MAARVEPGSKFSSVIEVRGKKYEIVYNKSSKKVPLNTTEWGELEDRTRDFFLSFDKSVMAGSKEMSIKFKARKFEHLQCKKDGVATPEVFEADKLIGLHDAESRIPVEEAIANLNESIGILSERYSSEAESSDAESDATLSATPPALSRSRSAPASVRRSEAHAHTPAHTPPRSSEADSSRAETPPVVMPSGEDIRHVIEEANTGNHWAEPTNVCAALGAAEGVTETVFRDKTAEFLSQDHFLQGAHYDQAFQMLTNARDAAKTTRGQLIHWTNAVEDATQSITTDSVREAAVRELQDLAHKPGTDDEGMAKRRLHIKLLQELIKNKRAQILQPYDICQLYSMIRQRPVIHYDAETGKSQVTTVVDPKIPPLYLRRHTTGYAPHKAQIPPPSTESHSPRSTRSSSRLRSSREERALWAARRSLEEGARERGRPLAFPPRSRILTPDE